MQLNSMRRLIVALVLASPLMQACALEPAAASALQDELQAETWLADASSRSAFCKRELNGELWARTELLFGLNRPGGTISQAQFERFLDHQVTPRFPDGLTVISGRGQFKGASGLTEKEGSKLLILLYPYGRASSRKVERIREDYQRMFEQQSVLRVDTQSCVSF
jgi:Protein of unknown function (DUF3574)